MVFVRIYLINIMIVTYTKQVQAGKTADNAQEVSTPSLQTSQRDVLHSLGYIAGPESHLADFWSSYRGTLYSPQGSGSAKMMK